MKKLFFLLLIANIANAQSPFDKLKSQYNLFRKEQKQDSALLVAKQMNNWVIQNESDTSLRNAISLRYIGDSFANLNKTDSAILYYQSSLRLLESLKRIDQPDYASILLNLGDLYYNKLNDFLTAEPCYEQALEIRKNTLGVENLDYADCSYRLGKFNLDSDSHAAEYYLMQALDIRKKILGDDHPECASIFNNLGILFSNTWNFKLSENYFKQAIEIRKAKLGKENAEYLNSLINLGEMYIKMGNYRSAENYLMQVYEIRRIILSKENPDYIYSLNTICNLYFKMGDYYTAEPYFKEAWEINKTFLKDDIQNYLSSLSNLGKLYMAMGNYKNAELYLQDELELRRKLSEKVPTNSISGMSYEANLYSVLGDYKSAKQILKHKKIVEDKHLPEVATCLKNLGNLYFQIKDYKSANQYFNQERKIKKIINKYLLFADALEIDFSENLNNQGIIFHKRKEFKSAENYFKQALEITKTWGERHPVFLPTMNNLGNLYLEMRDYKLAEYYLTQALAIMKNTLGEENFNYLTTLNSLAKVYFKTNRKIQALQIFSNNFAKQIKYSSDNFNWLLSSKQEDYWNQEVDFYENLSWISNQTFSISPIATGLNYDAVLFTKSKLLETKVINDDKYQEAYHLNQSVNDLKSELIYRRRLLFKKESEGSSEKNYLNQLRNEADSLDLRLSLKWPEYSQQKKNLNITWQQVQQNLNNDEAAIEFIRFKNENDSKYYYNALVLRKGDPYPQLVKLCKETDLQSITVNMDYSAYYILIWQPLENLLNEKKVIYYSPSGLLSKIPFHAIYAPEKSKNNSLTSTRRDTFIQDKSKSNSSNITYLIDRYSLHQLTSTRYLAMGLKQKENESVAKQITLVGGVNYDYMPSVVSKTAVLNTENQLSQRNNDNRGNLLHYLEHSKTEVDNIATILSPNKWQIKLIENNEATEENVVKQENSEAPAIIHIATHGYVFWEYNFTDSTYTKNALAKSYQYSTNPMVRSGLVLAGGNWAWAGSDTLSKLGMQQNGILTALEVSQLNLRKTKLVVLSACETGLGKIEGSEGVLGIKRGFKLAGVEQIIVSLWPVEDKQTMELMTQFYKNLGNTFNTVSSFENAQKYMRHKYPNDPKKWAGFVLVR